MGKVVTIQDFKEAKHFLKTSEGYVPQAAILVGLSENTLYRVKKAKNYQEYKELVRKSHKKTSTWKQTVAKVEQPKAKKGFWAHLFGR